MALSAHARARQIQKWIIFRKVSDVDNFVFSNENITITMRTQNSKKNNKKEAAIYNIYNSEF